MPAECCSVVFLSKLILQLLTVTLSNFELIIELETIETLFVPSAVTFSKCRSVTLEDFDTYFFVYQKIQVIYHF